MNKKSTIQKIKAGLTACLFLWSMPVAAQATFEVFSTKNLSEAYEAALSLQLNLSRKKLLAESVSPEKAYIQSLNEVLELLLLEDEISFERYSDACDARISQLEKNSNSAFALFALAEIRLHWSFVYLKFGHELDAAWNLRQSYQLVQECKKKFPDFYPIKKTSGVLEVMLGSVPEKYQWVLSLLSMEGSTEKGLHELEEIKNTSSTLHIEATLLYCLVQGFMLQQTDLAVTGIQDHLKNYGDNPLLLFFAGTLAIKNSQSEQALQYLKQAEKKSSGLQVPYVHYQLGEIYLHKGEYDQSIQQYQKFLKEYKGQNFVKDAWYKTAVCYYLKGDKQKANMPFEKAKQEGKESTEADKYAARSLAENQLPNVKLSKIRYATDGGYYEEAKKIATIVTPDELPTVKEKIEFTYRKARLAHKGGDELTAISLYKETIEQQQTEAWYFAPNACLQLGYIASDQKNSEVAAYWFNKALNYKKHEYKNSIDTKAKSALANLKK